MPSFPPSRAQKRQIHLSCRFSTLVYKYHNEKKSYIMIHKKKRLYLHVNHKVGSECVVIFTYTASKYTLFGKKPFVNKFISLSSQCWITISALSTMSERGSSWIGCFFLMCLLKFLFAVNLLSQ